MKILLVKRLESSFFAFKMSIKRFIESYTYFKEALEEGHVYFSNKHMAKVFEYLEKSATFEKDALLRACQDMEITLIE